jgi:disease resistance protein RPM1
MNQVREEDLCILGGLPILLKLILIIKKCEDSGKIRVIVNGAHGFSCLRKFWYILVGDGEMNLMFAAGSMPKLEFFETRFDAVKTESFTAGDFDFGIKNLACLTTIRCIAAGSGAGVDVIKAAKAAIERKVRTHPNHPRLFFEGLDQLVGDGGIGLALVEERKDSVGQGPWP